jgi:CRISPR-associated endonuclease/helicase Cas3
VYVVNIKNENLDKLPDIKIGADISRRLFDDIEAGVANPSSGNDRIDEYYRHYFFRRQSQMDFPTSGGGSVYDLLTNNKQGCNALANKGRKSAPQIRCAIRSAAENFYVIAPGQTSVIVPYENAFDLLDGLMATDDSDAKQRLFQAIGRYTVSLYGYQIQALTKSGALSEKSGFFILAKGFYDKDYGVNLEGNHEFLLV